MALNGVIVYFPWGAGGNFVRNIITMDTRFEYLDDKDPMQMYSTVEERYQHLLSYYSQDVAPDTWLKREWSIRFRLHARYYENSSIIYWNPDSLWAVDVHGTGDEISNILYNRQLKCYDRYKIDRGERTEQISPWTIKQCEHVFLLPETEEDTRIMAEIYNSKNPSINQFDTIENLDHRRDSNIAAITTMTKKLKELESHLSDDGRSVQHINFKDLYQDDGYTVVNNIIDTLSLQIPKDYIKTLHHLWLQSTRDVYYTYFNRKLPL